jgi:hypothetical protein
LREQWSGARPTDTSSAREEVGEHGIHPPDTRAEVREGDPDDKQWELVHALQYRGEREDFDVPVAQTTDFASVPRVFAWFIPPYGRYTKAAILHDYLWRQRASSGQMRWIDADGVLRRAMRELGVPFMRRWIMWAAVRWGALVKKDGTKGWLKEAPRVLLFTLVALPIVLPPAALIVIALVVFQIVEWLVWVPLTISDRVKRRRGRPTPKAVNAPRFSFKL